jgi:hypothetical protein
MAAKKQCPLMKGMPKTVTGIWDEHKKHKRKNARAEFAKRNDLRD